MKQLTLLVLLFMPFMAFADVADAESATDVVSDSGLVSEDTLSVEDTTEVSDVPQTVDVLSPGDVGDLGDVGTVPPLTPEKDSITQADVDLIVQAIKEENWMLLVGMILTLLVLVLDKWINIKQWVGEKGLPWVAASLGIVTHIGLALSTGTGWVTAIVTGLISGASAVGLWNLLGSKKQS